MSRENILFAIIGVLLGFIVGFMFASSMSQKAAMPAVAGSAAFQAKDYKKAIDYWQRVLKKVPPGSEVAETINARINEAKSLAASK